MSAHAPDALTLVRSLLASLRENPPISIFASRQDTDYFRLLSKKPKVNLPLNEPIPLFTPPQVPKLIPIPPPIKKIEVQVPKAPPPVLDKPDLPSPFPVSLDSANEWRKILRKAVPTMTLLDEIPSDAAARKIATRWKTKNKTAPISLLFFQELPEQRALLEQIALALDIYFGPARLVDAEAIEKENQWEAFLSTSTLKIAIVCDYTLWQLKGLMHFYKENPTSGVRLLGSTPVFLLPDLSLYLKDPLLKRFLWMALCQKISS